LLQGLLLGAGVFTGIAVYRQNVRRLKPAPV